MDERKMGIKLFTTFICLSLCQLNAMENPKEIKKIAYYPKEASDYYFKPISNLAVLGNVIYAVENLSNKVTAFKIELPANNFDKPSIKYAFDVGKPGQGPGDLMHPFTISIWDDEIVVKESGFFSFFGKNGEFRSKFRIFTENNSFVCEDNKIFWLNPIFKQNHLIEVYERDGKRINTIGIKNIKADISKFKNPFYIEKLLYEGKLLSDGNLLYYINARFGNYFIFSMDGQIVSQGDISNKFGERGKIIKAYSNDVYIKQIRKNDGNTGFPKSIIFEDAALYKDEIYFINSKFVIENNKVNKTIIEVIVLGLPSFNMKNEYVINKEGIYRIDSFTITDNEASTYMLGAMCDMEEGNFLELYKLK